MSGRHLTRRSDLTSNRKGLPKFSDVLIVDDTSLDARRVKATLSVIFGYELSVRQARTLSKALDCVLEAMPDVILLDDYLNPADTALQTIPMLRRAGYEGDIIVVSGQLDHARHRQLLAAGAVDAIHKDDFNSVRISEVLNDVLEKLGEDAQSGNEAGDATKPGEIT